MKPLDRYRGALLGLAVGDALGTTLEFKPRGTFKPVETMIGGGLGADACSISARSKSCRG